MKCKKCRHFYPVMVSEEGHGYNPFPCCQLWRDTGRHPETLTQKCFEPLQRRLVKNGKKAVSRRIPADAGDG